MEVDSELLGSKKKDEKYEIGDKISDVEDDPNCNPSYWPLSLLAPFTSFLPPELLLI